MPNLLKNQVTQDLKRRFGALDGYVIVDYRGLDSAQTFDLRRVLNTAKVRMTVVPNRLAVRVLDRWEGKNKEFREFFRGPTALVFGDDGALSASKAISQWKKKHKDLLPVRVAFSAGKPSHPAEWMIWPGFRTGPLSSPSWRGSFRVPSRVSPVPRRASSAAWSMPSRRFGKRRRAKVGGRRQAQDRSIKTTNPTAAAIAGQWTAEGVRSKKIHARAGVCSI